MACGTNQIPSEVESATTRAEAGTVLHNEDISSLARATNLSGNRITRALPSNLTNHTAVGNGNGTDLVLSNTICHTSDNLIP
jgi:hypothetical protein